MKPSSRLRQRLLVAGLMAAITSVSTGFLALPAALVEQTLSSADQPLQVKLTTSLNAETAHYGDQFEGVLTDSYLLGNKALPIGTVFKGRVQSARKSMPLGMPGYVVLEIDEAQFPSGVVHHFEHGGIAPKSARIVNPNAHTGKKLFKETLPYTVISTATSIPLKYAAGFSSWVILPIALGSRVALGVGMQLKNKNQSNLVQNQLGSASTGTPIATPIAKKVKAGVMQGSGLNSAYYFLTAAPEPVLTEGTVIPLHFRSQDMASLFGAGEATAQSEPQTPVEPIKLPIHNHRAITHKASPKPPEQAANYLNIANPVSPNTK